MVNQLFSEGKFPDNGVAFELAMWSMTGGCPMSSFVWPHRHFHFMVARFLCMLSVDCNSPLGMHLNKYVQQQVLVLLVHVPGTTGPSGRLVVPSAHLRAIAGSDLRCWRCVRQTSRSSAPLLCGDGDQRNTQLCCL